MSLLQDDSNSNSIEAKRKKRGKVFVVRESLHTNLMKNENIKSIYNMCVAIFLFALLDNISNDLLTTGRITFGLNTITQGFGKLHFVLAVLGLMHIPIIGLYYALDNWNHVLKKNKQSASLQRVWNTFCIVCLVGSQFGLIYTSSVICLALDLPFGSASVLVTETFRLMMKAHAFVRTIVPKLLAEQSKTEAKLSDITPISSYLYYLFAPTFIYQNSYPRTDRIRWKFAAMSLMEMIATIFLISFMYEGYILPSFKNFDKENLTFGDLSAKFFALMLPANLIFLSCNYMVIHCWFNFTGELMRFGDRLYYRDWWTSKDFKTYLRNWNITVHEWFYEFVYKDVYKYICKDSELAASLVVVYLSTFMHEYVLTLAMGMFCPVLSGLYGVVGVVLFLTSNKVPRSIGNVYVWLNFLSGSTVLICGYAMAFFSRKFVI